jgi:hypothetical protein
VTERHSFRPIVAGEVAWQRQLRDRYAGEPGPAIELDLRSAVVRSVSRETAERVILRYEWLGTLPPARRFYGIFFGPYVAGVTAVAVGNGTAGRAHLGYGVAATELATLVRGACVHWAPPGTNSKLVSWTVRLLREDVPDAKLVVAYADEEAGEIGTIYQACGWRYVGRTTTRLDLVSPEGRLMNQVYLTGWSRRRRGVDITKQRAALLAAGWKMQPASKKHRYVAILDRDDADLASRIAAMELPYPKRPRADVPSGRGESDDAPVDQAGEDPSRGSARSTSNRRGGADLPVETGKESR